MLILGIENLEPHEIDSRWIKVAEGVAETCYKMYKLAYTGLSPEYVRFNVADDVNGRRMHGNFLDSSPPGHSVLHGRWHHRLYYRRRRYMIDTNITVHTVAG